MNTDILKKDFELICSAQNEIREAYKNWKDDLKLNNKKLFDQLVFSTSFKEAFVSDYLRHNDNSVIPNYRAYDAHYYMILAILQ